MREEKPRPFRSRPVFRVIRTRRIREEAGQYKRRPKVEIDDQLAFTSIRLAKAGYFNGDPVAVLRAPVDVVENILSYEDFASEYETEYVELNKEK